MSILGSCAINHVSSVFLIPFCLMRYDTTYLVIALCWDMTYDTDSALSMISISSHNSHVFTSINRRSFPGPVLAQLPRKPGWPTMRPICDPAVVMNPTDQPVGQRVERVTCGLWINFVFLSFVLSSSSPSALSHSPQLHLFHSRSQEEKGSIDEVQLLLSRDEYFDRAER